MKNSEFANLANCKVEKDQRGKNKSLSKALDTLQEILNIDFGSLTIHFHKGVWSPKIEIKKSVFKNVEE